MNERRSDFELLREFVHRRDQVAFSVLVRRHLDLVYGTALRKVAEQGAAEEVVQDVFAALARSAWRFGAADSVPAWLHKTTLFKASGWWRGEFRRRRREQTAVELGTTMKTPDEQPALRVLVPLLDEALLSLREKDRTALLLRFHESQSFRDVAASLGVSEDAAQKRVAVALEKVTQFFQRRGFKTATVVAAAAALEHTAVAAPGAVAASITRAAFQIAPPAFLGLGLLARIATLTAAQKALVGVALLAITIAWYWKQNLHTAEAPEARVSVNAEPVNSRRDAVADVAPFRGPAPFPDPAAVADPAPMLAPAPVPAPVSPPAPAPRTLEASEAVTGAPDPQPEKPYTVRLSGLIDLPGYKAALLEVSYTMTNVVRSREGSTEMVSVQTNSLCLKEGESKEESIPPVRSGLRIEILKVVSATGAVVANERGQRHVYTFVSPENSAVGGRMPNVRFENADFQSALKVFGQLANRTVLFHPRLAFKPISLVGFARVPAEAASALSAAFKENHIATSTDGEKFEWVVPEELVPSLPKRLAPVSSTTTTGAEEALPAGAIQFMNAPMDPVLQIYAQLIGRKLVASERLVGMRFNLTTQTPLTREEVAYAFETLLAWQGLKIVPVGDTDFKVVSINER